MTEYIERSRLLERARKVTEYDEGGWCTTYQAVSVRDIGLIPAADVAPVVHGEWIVRFDGRYSQRRTYCSVCGKHSGIGGNKQESSYCPNCGAKMEGVVKNA